MAVPAWWAVSRAKAGIGMVIRFQVNGNVMASSENRSKRQAIVYACLLISSELELH